MFLHAFLIIICLVATCFYTGNLDKSIIIIIYVYVSALDDYFLVVCHYLNMSDFELLLDNIWTDVNVFTKGLFQEWTQQ